MASKTLTLGETGAAEASQSAYLFLVMRSSAPAAPSPSWRVSLEHATEVVIGRGATTRVERSGRHVAVEVEDGWMSSRHARLRRAAAGWEVEDAGSKNGTLVDGRAIERRLLQDGELVEVGRTFFLYRAALPSAPHELLDLRSLDLTPPVPELATLSPTLAEALRTLPTTATSSLRVLVEGPTGSGKELVARAVHALSGRGGPLIVANCASFDRALIASELFGYVKGAHSTALADGPGLFRSAHQGTLFLDEIGELPLDCQATLLRVVQEGEVRPVGSPRAFKVDVKLVCATHRVLSSEVAAARFREDLFHRLAERTYRLPALRERREDLGLMVAALLERHAGRRASAIALAGPAARALLQHDWPGNVRALESALKVALADAAGGEIELRHLPMLASPTRPPAARPPAVAEGSLSDEELRHRDELVRRLTERDGNLAAVAKDLGRARVQIDRWAKRYGIDLSRFRPASRR